MITLVRFAEICWSLMYFGEKARVRVAEILVVYDVVCLLTNVK